MIEKNKEIQYYILNIRNAEKIGFIGDSYTESHFSIEGKAYICKLSLFSDYNYENFAKSGDTYRGNLDRMRKEIPIYHDKLTWKDIKPKYALLVSYTNDLKYMEEAQYLNDLRAIIETVKGLGAIPIIATEYHCNFGVGLQIGLRQVAEEYQCEFIDILDSVERTRGTNYEPFWSGTHPGTRTNHLMGDNFEVYLDKLPRPRQSLKVFRLRGKYKDLNDLIFNTNEERAKLFKEINIGHNALVDFKKVDQVTAEHHNRVISEYLKLQNGEAVDFKDAALISAILPCTSLGLNYIALDLGDLEANVYVKDVMAEPYPTPVFYQRFDVGKDYHAAIGDTYVSDNPHFKDVTFTIKEVGAESLLALPYPRIDTTIQGNLIKGRGEGDEEIPYSYTAIGFSNDYPEGKAKVGHYVMLERVNGKYNIPKVLMSRCIDYDKLHFLIVQEGDFSIQTLNIEWLGEENKVYVVKPFKILRAKGNEIIPHTKLGNKEEVSKWCNGEKFVSFIPEDGCLPKGCVGCIEISETQRIRQSVNYVMSEETREVHLEVVARYFPEIFKPKEGGTCCPITLESYDYAEVCVDMTYKGKVFTQKKRVGLHWKEVIFQCVLPAYTDEVEVKVYSAGYPIQVTKISMKEL